MMKLACAVGTLGLILAACSTPGDNLPTAASASVGVTDCTSGQDNNFLNETRMTGVTSPASVTCSGNGY